MVEEPRTRSTDWNPERVISAERIVETVDAQWPLEPLARRRPEDVAHRYRYRDGGGEIGVITSVTQPVCGDCSRARLSADGRLYTCLFSSLGHDLKTPLRDESLDDDHLRRRIAAIWSRRADRYSEERTEALASGRFVAADKVEMFRIGG